MPLFDWRYIKSWQIGIKQLLGCVILNLGYHLGDSRMKWYWRSVNPNLILWCIHQPVNIYRSCLKRYLICAVVVRSIAFLQKLQNEIKKKKYYFKVYNKTVSFFWKLTKMLEILEMLEMLVSRKFLKLLFLSAWGRWLFYLRTEKMCPSEAVSSLRFPL